MRQRGFCQRPQRLTIVKYFVLLIGAPGALCLSGQASAGAPPVPARKAQRETALSPVEVTVKLAQPNIRAGDPVVLQYQLVNTSSSGSYALCLPDLGKVWLTLRLRDKSAREVGLASLTDFAGERTVRAVTLQNRQPLVWTRLYIWPTYGGRRSVFSDEVTLDAQTAAALVPGSYTLSAEVILPYAVDTLGRKRDTLAYGFPYETKSAPKGRMLVDLDTGQKTFVPDLLDPSRPTVPKATAEVRKVFMLPLDVSEGAASVHREAETLATRIAAAYPAPPDLPLPAVDPAQVPSGVTVYGIVRSPYNIQFRDIIDGSRADIQTLFSLRGPAAQRSRLSVAKTIADAAAAGTGKSHRTGLGLFYGNVALVGTPDAADFLADQAWNRKRPEALGALARMHEYGGLKIRQQIKGHFVCHQAKMPTVMKDFD